MKLTARKRGDSEVEGIAVDGFTDGRSVAAFLLIILWLAFSPGSFSGEPSDFKRSGEVSSIVSWKRNIIKCCFARA